LKEALSKKESAFFKVDPHLNRNGHKIIAEGIYKYLLPKLIPENNN